MPLILLVEDELELTTVMEKYLHHAGFETQIIVNGLVVVDWVKQNYPDVILLDIMLPGKDGLTICQEICEFSDIPIIMTTAKVDEIDRLIGFQAGADDYVCKPYSPRELIARVKTCLRRMNKLVMSNDPVSIDEQQLSIMLNGQSIELTVLEI